MTTAKKAKPVRAASSAKDVKVVKPQESPSLVEEVITHHIGIRELRQDASRVIELVEKGDIVLITKHGKPVATLNPIKKSKLQILIDAGMVTPAKKKFNARDWKPSMPPASPELIAAIIADMKSSRY
jgi:prevent-host-death family protein